LIRKVIEAWSLEEAPTISGECETYECVHAQESQESRWHAGLIGLIIEEKHGGIQGEETSRKEDERHPCHACTSRTGQEIDTRGKEQNIVRRSAPYLQVGLEHMALILCMPNSTL
jgi:hypothetical protein